MIDLSDQHVAEVERVAERNRAAGTWVEIVGPSHLDPNGELKEGLVGMFDELLHPRSRVGRFVDAPDRPKGTAKEIGEAFGAFEHGGLALTAVRHREYPPSGGSVHLDIADGEHRVGLVVLSWQGGTLVLDRILLHPGYQDRGFASVFVPHMKDTARRLGMSQISLTAVDVGSYAWAKAGWLWMRDPTAESNRLLNLARQEGRWGEAMQYVPREVADEFVRRVVDGEFGSEAEMAAFGREVTWEESGHTMWLGKAVMRGGRWQGKLTLD